MGPVQWNSMNRWHSVGSGPPEGRNRAPVKPELRGIGESGNFGSFRRILREHLEDSGRQFNRFSPFDSDLQIGENRHCGCCEKSRNLDFSYSKFGKIFDVTEQEKILTAEHTPIIIPSNWVRNYWLQHCKDPWVCKISQDMQRRIEKYNQGLPGNRHAQVPSEDVSLAP